MPEQRRIPGGQPGGDAAGHRGVGPLESYTSASVDYRCDPKHLTTPQIIAEIVWIGDAAHWPCSRGRYARHRVAALRGELRRREGVEHD